MAKMTYREKAARIVAAIEKARAAKAAAKAANDALSDAKKDLQTLLCAFPNREFNDGEHMARVETRTRAGFDVKRLRADLWETVAPYATATEYEQLYF